MEAVLGKVLAGLGQGMATVGAASLQDQIAQKREERLMALRGAQEQSIYTRNRSDQLADVETAKQTAAQTRLSEQEFQGGMAAYRTSAEANAAAQAALDAQKLERLRQQGDIKKATIAAAAKEGGTIGGWKSDDLEKEANRLAATGLGLSAKDFDSWDKNTQLVFSDQSARTVAEFRRNPEAGVNAAYNRVVKGEDMPSKPWPWPQSSTMTQATTPLSSVTRPTVIMPNKNIPAAAVDMLRKNPSLASQFEQKYGVRAKDYLQ